MVHKDSFDKKVQVSVGEYTLLKRVYSLSKKQAALMRILEAEKQLAQGRTRIKSFDEILSSL